MKVLFLSVLKVIEYLCHEQQLQYLKWKHTDLELLFLPRHENHQRPPFLGIFSFTMFSNAAWSKCTEFLILKTQT